VGRGPGTNRLDFGGDPDHDPDAGIFFEDFVFTIAIPIDSRERSEIKMLGGGLRCTEYCLVY